MLIKRGQPYSLPCVMILWVNTFQRILHGGVISAVLDTVGGLTVMASLADRAAGLSEEKGRGHVFQDRDH